MPPRIYINQMTPNQLVEGVFTMQNCQMGLTKSGKPYLKCLVADRTGRTPARMWSVSEEFVQGLPADGFIHLEGQTQAYQGELQIIIKKLRPTEPRPEDLHDLLPSTEKDIDEMFSKVTRLLEGMSSDQLKTLARAYLNDKELMDLFKQAPAATALHHAFLGGLLEHTLAVMKLADAITPLYPKINNDLVLFGLFLHDLGKCVELQWDAGFSYSDDGQLVGHIARGVIWLNEKARQCRDQKNPIDPAVVRVLEHIILSHHGQPEFGALKIPATPEAVLISLIDNVDAKTQMAIDAGRAETRAGDLGSDFTERIWALGTRIYRPDPLENESAETDQPPLKGGI